MSGATEAWVLGGTGRTGRAIAAQLVSRRLTPVLVGRDAGRLATVAAELANVPSVGVGTAAQAADILAARVVVAADLTAMAEAIRAERPTVVINTVGPFRRTAPPLLDACAAVGAHYVDLANDAAAVLAVLERHDEFALAGMSGVTGAGFGVVGTESVVVALRDHPSVPSRVRVDMVPSIDIAEGALGEALAASITEGVPGLPGGGRYAGRRYRGERLSRAPLGGDPLALTLPDGTEVTTVSMPTGELIAAQRATGAPDVVAATSEFPSSALLRTVLPVVTLPLYLSQVRLFVTSRLAGMRVKERPRSRPHSWGHARLEWPDGSAREGWSRVGDAGEFTAAVAAEVARRLLVGQGRPGAFTPASLFGHDLASACGAELRLG